MTKKRKTYVSTNGYRLVYAPDHPHASNSGYVYEQRLVMEQHLGRYLHADEVVKRKNGRRLDNRISNLEIGERVIPASPGRPRKTGQAHTEKYFPPDDGLDDWDMR